jgi:hypothetical protein
MRGRMALVIHGSPSARLSPYREDGLSFFIQQADQCLVQRPLDQHMVRRPDFDRLSFLQGSQLLVQLAFEPALSDAGNMLQGARIKPVQMQVISMPGDEVARPRLPAKLLSLLPNVVWQHNHGIPGSIRMGLYRDGLLHSDLLKV